jgi:hypothetical protein
MGLLKQAFKCCFFPVVPRVVLCDPMYFKNALPGNMDKQTSQERRYNLLYFVYLIASFKFKFYYTNISDYENDNP